MKPQKLWTVSTSVILLSVLLAGSIAVGYFFPVPVVFYAEMAVAAVGIAWTIVRQYRFRRDVKRYLAAIAGRLGDADRQALFAFPIPTVAVGEQGEIIWYNPAFEQDVLDGGNAYGESIEALTGGLPVTFFQDASTQPVRLENRWYTVYSNPVESDGAPLYLLYYVDDTEHQEMLEEYAQSRPIVMALYIDNVEELMQNTRDSERAQITGRVETLLEDWVSEKKGIMRRYSNERFLVILEQRYLGDIIKNKFHILDQVRAVQTVGGTSITLSIGVGQGDTLLKGEEMARQALEMALGRGGDQAAVKTSNGYDFYGGVSKGVERRARVRTRVVASALVDLIKESQNVLVMGHRYSDLDCLGAAAGMTAIVRQLGKPAHVVTDRSQTLAPELLDLYAEQGKTDVFIHPDDALDKLTSKTLLIITDTHNPVMLECLPLYQQAKTVVVIDHHRKMVNYIDNAVIFYHEPNASSASEMVTELAQYMGEGNLSRVDAEALLAGIMLDTRSFVMKAGVRTFEAAAYLRQIGADTVEVKRLFSENMQVYRKKSDIVAHAEMYRCTAIAYDGVKGDKEVRIAASQAADELLSIRGVEASFTLFRDGESINVSARSLGNFNVQLVMEALGGGGHLTMAGACLPGIPIEEAKLRLQEAIDTYLEEREPSSAV